MMPFVNYFTVPKNAIHKYLSPIYVHPFFATTSVIQG